MLNKIKSFFEKHPEEEEAIETLEEIMDQREERGDEVLVADDEVLLMKNLFHLRDIRAEDVLIPRGEISAISVTAKLADLKKIILTDKFTRIPVYEKTLDNIVGVLHTKDLLCALLQKKDISIENLMHKNVLFVPTSVHVLDLLRDMQAKSMQLCVVVDEFGGTAGLITLEDLLEEIVGEIEDEHDALDAPPAPITSTFLSFNDVYSSMDLTAPVPSVLYPFAMPFLNVMVFTAFICLAVSSISSRYSITWVLYGIVIFNPIIFNVFADSMSFSMLSTLNATYT